MNEVLLVRGAQPAKSISEAVLLDHVADTFGRWTTATNNVPSVLIGDIALNFYARPQATDRVELIYADLDPLRFCPQGFWQNGASTWIDEKTGTSVHITTPSEGELPSELAIQIQGTAVSVEGTRVSSLHGLIAAKLSLALRNERERRRHEHDIIRMVTSNPSLILNDMAQWRLSPADVQLLALLQSIARD